MRNKNLGGILRVTSPAEKTPGSYRLQYANLDSFLVRWKSAERKEAIIAELAAAGLPLEPLLEEVGKELDPFDLICHIAFDQPALTRAERANQVKKRDVFTKYGPQARAVLEAVLRDALVPVAA